MSNPLRDRRTPSELAASGQVIDFEEKISAFRRLAEIVEADLEALDPDKLPGHWQNAKVAGRLDFGFVDAQYRLPALDGRVEVTIDAVCQRCLEPFQMPLVAELHWVFVTEPIAVDASYENWELEEDELRPLDVVEETLIMALPLVTMHPDDAACSGPVDASDANEGTVRPFADLKSQMNREN